jgi:tetratricopeptide (TPR) repeat protein
MSWKGFRERPILGWGQDNFILVFSKYYEPALWNREQWFDRSHNVFLDWLIAGGILGLLAYLSLFASGLYALWKNARFTFNEKSVLTGLLAAYFFQNLFTFDNLTSYLLFVSVLGFVSTQAPPVEAPVPARGVRRDRAAAVRLSYASLPFLLAGLGFALYAANAKPLAASRNLVRALAPPSGVLSDSLAYFKEVFDAGTFGSGEAREQMVLAALRLRAINAPDSVKREFLTRARSEMLRQIEQAPQDARYELYLGSLLETYGAYDEALRHLQRAHELSPRRQMVLFQLAAAHRDKGDAAGALPYLKQAWEEAPDYGDARLRYGAGLLYAGRDREAQDVLLPVYGTMLIPEDQILAAYEHRGMYDTIIAVRKKELESSPNDQRLELALAAAYLKAGKRDDAVSVIQRVMSRDPSFKTQGAYYIDEIRAGRNP